MGYYLQGSTSAKGCNRGPHSRKTLLLPSAVNWCIEITKTPIHLRWVSNDALCKIEDSRSWRLLSFLVVSIIVFRWGFQMANTQDNVELFQQKTTFYCEGVVVPEGGRERTQGYQLRLETAPVVLYVFLIIGVELWEARGDRKVEGGGGRGEEGEGARGWGEAHRVRFTPALLLCSLLDRYLWNVQGTFSWIFYVPMSA